MSVTWYAFTNGHEKCQSLYPTNKLYKSPIKFDNLSHEKIIKNAYALK